MSNKPLLSIGMIVKNEIRCLEKCLKALRPLRDAIPCELVIADTGSTDGTREIAEKYADILFDFAWVNDFSAARNAVIERCSGKWFMTVDADEYLVSEKELVEFLTGKQADIADYCTYVQRNHGSADMKGLYTDFPAFRMGRLHPGLRYHGTIHEAFWLTDGQTVEHLNHTIFDHDGYADITPEHNRKKSQRNLQLLEQELNASPTNAVLYLQCLESAASVEEDWAKYAYRAMDVAMNHPEYSQWKIIAPVIVSRAVVCACMQSLPEAINWIEWGRKTFPQSYHVKIDVNYNYFCILRAYNQYEDMISVGEAYLEGISDYNEKGYSGDEVCVSALTSVHPSCGDKLKVSIAEAYFKTGKLQQAKSVLDEIDLCSCGYDVLNEWLRQAEQLARATDVEKMVTDKVSYLCTRHGSLAAEDELRWKTLIRHISELFSKKENKDIWKLYQQIPGVVGSCAQIIDAEDVTCAQEILNGIADWEQVIPAAVCRAMELGLSFPDGFYRASVEQQDRLVEYVAQKGIVRHAFRYTEVEQITDRFRLSFAYRLLFALCMYKENFVGAYGEPLGQRLAQIGESFLLTYYAPDMIADEEAIAELNNQDRFTWYFVRAMKQREEQNLAGYVKNLRQALAQTDSLIKFVKYLLDEVQHHQESAQRNRVSPELLALAQQVKTILAAYPADDPAVMQLKQTPAYQQVAFLIEGAGDLLEN